jgi:hypothetical protein
MKRMTSLAGWCAGALAVLGTLAVAQEGRGRAADARERVEVSRQHGELTPQSGQGMRQGGQRMRQSGELGRLRHDQHAQRMRERVRFLRELGITDAQRALALEQSRLAEQTGRAARREALRLRMDARGAGPRTGRGVEPERDPVQNEARRSELRALRERTAGTLAQHGRALLSGLTPEQRARIESRLAARGRTFDEERCARRLGLWLASPRTRDRLEARAGR